MVQRYIACSVLLAAWLFSISGEVRGNVYRITELTEGYTAVDTCFLVSAAHTMIERQRWLQLVVPMIEQQLTSRGVGNDTATPNRYCLVQFGGRGRFLRAHFLLGNNSVFFKAESFVHARRQLRRNGDIADGYEAIEFTLREAEFREDPNIARVIVLVTNMGRSVLVTSSDLTREGIFVQLRNQSVIFDTIIEATMTLSESPGETILGLTGIDSAAVLRPNASYEILQGDILYEETQAQTIESYISLTLALGGLSWPIELLAAEDIDTIGSFANAFLTIHGLSRFETSRVCQRCTCEGGESGEGGEEGCASALLDCQRHEDQVLCTCLVESTPEECGTVRPTQVVPEVTSVLPDPPTQDPFTSASDLFVNGSVAQYPDGEVDVTFYSNRGRATFECILLHDSNAAPPVIPCISPLSLKDLSPGHYQLVIIAKRTGNRGTRVLDFSVGQPPTATPFEVTLTTLPEFNGSVAVVLMADRSDIRFQCSLGGQRFLPCTSPHTIAGSDIHEEGLAFIVVATDSSGQAAAAVLQVERPTPPVPMATGPVMIHVESVDPPDLFGKIRIRFNTSRPDALCICRVNSTRPSCSNEYTADPRVLGQGALDVTIVCMDSEGYVDTRNIKLNLITPPPPPPGPLSCDLSLTGPTPGGVLSTVFSCDRRVATTCQIANRAPEPCVDSYEVDVSELGPGPHLFILSVDDGYGKSLMKVYPFTLGTAIRRCCPVISPNSSVAVVGQLTAELSLHVTPGNCSHSEGFSYMVSWGDGASEAGTTQTLSPVFSSQRRFLSAGNYTVEVLYCNSPSQQLNQCCDSHTHLLHLHSTQ